MLYKAANCRQAAVAGDSRVPSFRFDMIQKSKHAVGLDVFEGQVGYRLAFLIAQKHVEKF
jgi:hypothetical protein